MGVPPGEGDNSPDFESGRKGGEHGSPTWEPSLEEKATGQ